MIVSDMRVHVSSMMYFGIIDAYVVVICATEYDVENLTGTSPLNFNENLYITNLRVCVHVCVCVCVCERERESER